MGHSRLSFGFAGQVESPKIVCATVVIESGSTKKRKASPSEVIVDRIANSLYQKCRLQTYVVDGFPNFGPLVAELSDASGNDVAASGEAFKVSTLHPSGNLIVQEQFFQQFGKEDSATYQEFTELVAAHNETYNADNLRLTERPAASPKSADTVKVEFLVPEDGEELTPDKVSSLPDAPLVSFNDFILR